MTISPRAKRLAEKLQHMAKTQAIYEAIQAALDEERAETLDEIELQEHGRITRAYRTCSQADGQP